MSVRRHFKTALLNIYSSNLLIFNYCHIGFKKNLTSHSYKKAILCFYSNVAIINPPLILANLKFCLNFLFKLLLRGLKTCFILFNFPKFFRKFFFFSSQFYFFNTWISGYLTNRTARRYNFPNRKKYCARIPNSLVVFGAEPQKSIDIAYEANKLLIPSFIFADSLSNLSKYSYWIPMNLKSGYTKIFFANLINNFLEKVTIYRKFFFFKNMHELYHKKIYTKRLQSLSTVIEEKELRDFVSAYSKLFLKWKKHANTPEEISSLFQSIIDFKKAFPKNLWRVQRAVNKIKRLATLRLRYLLSPKF